jgi:hypothetical protein
MSSDVPDGILGKGKNHIRRIGDIKATSRKRKDALIRPATAIV